MKSRLPEWSVRQAEPHEDYSILLTFADGTKRIYNARPLLDEPLYAKLKDPAFFMKAYAKYGTVLWTEDLDIAPEHLYECSKIVG